MQVAGVEISAGQKASRTLTLTAEHVQTFAALTGDFNPLHFDEAFAAKTKFKRLVVQGGLTTGLFTAPVFIGDTITAEAEVLSVHATKPVTQLKVAVRRQDGEVVLEGEAWCYTFAVAGG
jgi:acyl dehydratase